MIIGAGNQILNASYLRKFEDKTTEKTIDTVPLTVSKIILPDMSTVTLTMEIVLLDSNQQQIV